MRAADGRSAPHRSASREQTGRAVPAEAEARASVIHHSSRPYVCAAGARDSGSRPPSPEPPPPHPPPCAGRGDGGWGGPGEDTWPGSCGDVGRAHDSGPAGHLVASLRLQAWGLRSPGAWGGGPQRHRGNVDEAPPSGDNVRPRGRCADGPRAPRREDAEPLVGGSGLLRPAAACAPHSCTPAPSAGGGETPSQRQQTQRRGA